MHVGVDATCWLNNRGYGRHARALLGALVRLDKQNRYTLVVDDPTCVDRLPVEAEVRLVYSNVPATEAASSRGSRSIGDMWRMSRALSDSSFDLVFVPTVYTYVPLFGRAKKVVAVHDVIVEKFPYLTTPSARAHLFWRIKVLIALRQADAIVTLSNYSKVAIMDHFGIASQRVRVVGVAPDSVFRVLEDPRPTSTLAAKGISAKNRIVTYVGGFSPYKNLEALVSAFAQIAAGEEFSDVQLVMVGENRKEVFYSCFATIEREVKNLALTNRVVFTGYLPDEDVVALLNLSTVLVLPSLMEGFGLPPVEAAACGCPVIATSASPLPQLLGEGALYFDPQDHEALLTALTRVLGSEELRNRMRQAGTAAAARLTWDAAARQMMAVLAEVGTP